MGLPTHGDKVEYISEKLTERGGKEYLDESDDWTVQDGGTITKELQDRGMYIYMHDSGFLKATVHPRIDGVMVQLAGGDSVAEPKALKRDRFPYAEDYIEDHGGESFLKDSDRWELITEEMHPKDLDPQRIKGATFYQSTSGYLRCRVSENTIRVTLTEPFEHWDIKE